jgi:hypothetical protein
VETMPIVIFLIPSPTSTANEIVGIFILAMIVLPILFGIPFALGWLLDRKAPSDEGPRIAACMLIAEIWTLLILSFAGLIAIWTHLFVFPPALALVLVGYFASRWRRRVADRRSLPK